MPSRSVGTMQEVVGYPEEFSWILPTSPRKPVQQHQPLVVRAQVTWNWILSNKATERWKIKK